MAKLFLKKVLNLPAIVKKRKKIREIFVKFQQGLEQNFLFTMKRMRIFTSYISLLGTFEHLVFCPYFWQKQITNLQRYCSLWICKASKLHKRYCTDSFFSFLKQFLHESFPGVLPPGLTTKSQFSFVILKAQAGME